MSFRRSLPPDRQFTPSAGSYFGTPILDRPDPVRLRCPETRVWKAGQPVPLSDLQLGDLLLVNLTSEQKNTPAHCTDLWITEATGKTATTAQSKKNSAVTKKDKPAKKK